MATAPARVTTDEADAAYPDRGDGGDEADGDGDRDAGQRREREGDAEVAPAMCEMVKPGAPARASWMIEIWPTKPVMTTSDSAISRCRSAC